MNNLQVFNHEQFGEVRTIHDESNNEIWFVAKDIIDILELSNTTVALQSLEDFERTKFNLGRQGETNMINESGMYALIIRSRKPQARNFRIWITSEVLPSIRKNGGYIANQENMTPEQIVANALIVAQNIIKDKELQLEQANEVIEIQKPKVQAWEKLMNSKNNLNMSQVAKAFSIPGLGRNNLLKLLRDEQILRANNEPYQSQLNNGRFTTVLTEKNGFSCSVTVMTPKGLKWLAGQLVDWGYIE